LSGPGQSFEELEAPEELEELEDEPDPDDEPDPESEDFEEESDEVDSFLSFFLESFESAPALADASVSRLRLAVP